MSIRAKILFLLFLLLAGGASAQNVRPGVGERIFIRGGVADVAVENKAHVDLGAMTPDSLFRFMAAVDSLRGDGVEFDRARIDSIVTAMIDRTSPTGDTLSAEEIDDLIAQRRLLKLNPGTVRYFMDDRAFLNRYIGGGVDTLLVKLIQADTLGLTKRQKRQLARNDTTAYRYNKIFRDTMKISPVVAISAVVPGFAQFYNEQYWKIPVLYGTVGAGIGLWAWQTSKFKPYRNLFNFYQARPVEVGTAGFEEYKATMTELQGNMIRHNTYRQMAFGLAAASYIYFLVDGTLNYPGAVNHVKKATTLSMVCPGAGQFYNQTYWKVPVVIGGTAALIYCIDFNNRGYQRFMRAYNLVTDGNDETIDEFRGQMSANDLLNIKNSYRRNRDLCIILTGLFYVIQVIDAHATAHMKTYDISDDLSRVTFEPHMDNFYTHRMGGNVRTFGFSLNLHF